MFTAQRALVIIISLLSLTLVNQLWDDEAFGRMGQSITMGMGGTEAMAQNDSIHSSTASAACDGLVLGDILIVLKTGSTELYDKLPIHLATTFACAVDHLVYSDLDQWFGDIHVRDALALTSPNLRHEHEELEQYRRLQRHVIAGGDVAELGGDKSWRLDKWKFMPMISDAYATYGRSKKWYIFVEADTYVSLHNLVLWLRALDPHKAVYAGAQVMIGDSEFGHGGSGFVLSQSAAQRLSDAYLQNMTRWEEQLVGECCGDKVMAEVLRAADPPVHLLRAFPHIQGETVASLDWSPTHWCMPAITWHHVDAAGIHRLAEADRIWRETHDWNQPVRFADYYARLVEPRIYANNGTLTDWDNLSDEWVVRKGIKHHKSSDNAENCEAFCRSEDECLQWFWAPGICRGGKKPRLGWALDNRPALGSAGHRVAKLDSQESVSGWLVDRLEAYKAQHEPCSTDEVWITRND
ncbi:Glycosyltransferase family 31 protein [Teratosphaeria destructans]|uniref:N-acetylgalactosaminide beta-1,3-galactosyltransferase n=1 Tax=Teratosphaeria destructans TaxID=418781 RepID=A0A9W7SYK8_9PEZI|nr:Glycosyltransferase family 31 protein [Teratosphaeria destructans]